jgi:catechol 2,3-dioxygenase-like lactoylglutathione lyase family enzyme
MPVSGIDHAAAPMEHVDEMIAFYRALGFEVRPGGGGMVYAAHAGQQKINFHAPALWKRSSFTLRGPKAVPGSADFCFTWDGTQAELDGVLAAAGATVEEGPVSREGGAGSGMSTYLRDPDGNLLEFIIY